MRKLKLQMNLLLDNKWDAGMSKFSLENLITVDTILHGRVTAEGFIPYWTEVANDPTNGEHALGKRFMEIPNVVISNTLKESKWPNTTVLAGSLEGSVTKLKHEGAGDILVYGGNSFAASLIQHGLVDEYHVMINPSSLGNGQSSFNPVKDDSKLSLKECTHFDCGAVLLRYLPKE